MQIMKYVEDGAKKAIEDAKKVNHDVNMEKLLQLISEEEQQEQERINVSK